MSELTINRLSGLALVFTGLVVLSFSALHSTIAAGCAVCVVGLVMIVVEGMVG